MDKEDNNKPFDFCIGINEMAKTFNVSKATLRYYGEVGLIDLDRNSENDYREFDRVSLVQMTDVVMLRQLGIPIKRVQHIRDMQVEELLDEIDIINRETNEKIQNLVRINAELKKYREVIKKYLELRIKVSETVTELDFDFITSWSIRDKESNLLFLEHPYDIPYCAIFNSGNTEEFKEGLCLSKNSLRKDVVWESKKSSGKFLKCMMIAENAFPNKNNLREHISKVNAMGYDPGTIIAKFLVEDYVEGKEGHKKKMDFYETFIELL